jgi:phosphonate transport system ATP-binding protein
MPALPPPALEVAGLVKSYRSGTVLQNLSLTLRSGAITALLGPSGAGKTTLFRCIAGLTPVDGGEIRLFGQALSGLSARGLREARRQTGLIFQQFNLVRRLSALDNVLAGRLGRVPAWRVVTRRFGAPDRQLALELLDRVGLLSQAYQRADRLSGGQQQRVAIARALAQESRLILADEPVASLDPVTGAETLALMRAIALERGITVLCSLHQVELVAGFADRVLALRRGAIEEAGAATETRSATTG